MDEVRVFAPATVANIGCGYDILGLALDNPGDEVVIRLNDSKMVTLDLICGDDGRLPLDPEKNTVSSVVIKYLRNVYKKQGVGIKLYKKIMQWGNIAGLISGFYQNDFDLIGRSMEDFVAEPVRSAFIPYFYEMRTIALKHHAIGFGISGSGPTVFALCRNEKDAGVVSSRIMEFLKIKSICATFYVSSINFEGARIIN